MYPPYQSTNMASAHTRDTQTALQYWSNINPQAHSNGPYVGYPYTTSGAPVYAPFPSSPMSPTFPSHSMAPAQRASSSRPRAGSVAFRGRTSHPASRARGSQQIALSREQRGRCHIAGLPFELLSAIMGHVAARDDSWDSGIRPRQVGNLKNLSQTCSHWRKVLFESKEVWTDIPLSSAGWTKVALASSAPRAIQLAAHSDFVRSNSEGLMESLEHIYRADSLSLHELFSPEVQAMLVSHPAPKLEQLTISFEGSEHPVGFGMTLHEDLFARQVPKLRTLTLSYCILPPAISILQAPLTILTLENCAVWHSMNDMANTFRHLPRLEHLGLMHSIPGTDIPPDGPPIVTLPRLITLSLAGLSDQLAPALCTIGFPAALEILRIEFWLQTLPNTNWTLEHAVLNLDHVLAKRIFVDAIRAGVSYEYVGVEANERRYPGIRCLDPPKRSVLPRCFDMSIHCVEHVETVDHPWTKNDWHSFLYFFRNALPIAKAKELFIDLARTEDWHWIRLMGGFTNLSTVELCGLACTSLVRRRDREPALSMLPELTRLTLQCAPMDEPKTFKALEILIEIMKSPPTTRKWNGLVVLKNCRLPRSLNGWLRQVEGLGYIEWDGRHGGL